MKDLIEKITAQLLNGDPESHETIRQLVSICKLHAPVLVEAFIDVATMFATHEGLAALRAKSAWTLFAAYRIAAIGSASDFKEMTSFQFAMTGEMVLVPQGGNLSHVGFIDSPHRNRVRTRGAITTLTREMMINDDRGAFLRIPKMFARKAAIVRERVVLKTFFDNLATMATVANGNLITNNLLGITGLGSAVQKFAEQKGLEDEDGNADFILIPPSFLLVPPALEPLARSIYTSTTVNETTDVGKPKPVNNPYVGSYEPLTSPYIGEAGGLGGKNDSFGVFADPNFLAAVEILYLNGVQTPIIESGETDFDTLGMSWRCYFDFGVAPGNHRAFVWSVSGNSV